MAIAGADTRGYNVLDSCRVAKQRVVEIHLAPDDRWMKAMSSVWNRPVVAAAGGINAGNVAAYAEAGADIVVTSSPIWQSRATCRCTSRWRNRVSN